MSAGDPRGGQDDFEEFLRRSGPEEPSPEARAEARRAFLAAGREATPGSRAQGPVRMGRVMPDPTGHFRPHPTQDEADGFAAWVAAASAVPGPSPEVVRRARLAFLSALASAPPVLQPRSRSYRALVWLAAAAAIVLVTLFAHGPERWKVRLDGSVALDEVEFDPRDEDRLAADLEGSGWIETREGRARFVLADVLEIEVLPGSSFHFPPLPELDGVATLDFELTRGEAYVRTLGGYPGNPVRIHADGSDVVLSGTTVGVLVDEAGTCVCVAEGKVRVTSHLLAAGTESVAANRSLRLFRDPTREALTEPFPLGGGAESAHVQELLRFHQGG